ncbi:ComF family protein [Paenibacillus monticola]|uniref:ComF family protein n=1 Tax=Paenibacillus monticola TaxID=2666075 RepID=A0A7X2H670_9BACL|nr:ComF family protein [Paenibacillus monticola]MRN54281.1 ComF family protein [Paenibacillus monticola]
MNTKSIWLKGLQSLLTSSVPQCLICGKHRQASSQLPSICVNCAAAIPWIVSPRCLKCGRHVGCPDCNRGGETSPIICNRSAVAYNSVMREMLGQYKYRGNERYSALLGLMLDRAYLILKEEREKEQRVQRSSPHSTISSFFQNKRAASGILWQADLLVPVPVSDSQLEERGFNQAERLADVVSQRRGIPQLPLLVRKHHTGKQSFKGRAERLADMKHAFAASPAMIELFPNWLGAMKPMDRPLQIIIIDDIYTTGSTLRACAEVIQQMTEAYRYDVEIYSLTWARS